MDKLKALLLGSKNLQLLEAITIKQIHKQSGVLFSSDNPFFNESLRNVTTAIINEELGNFANYPLDQRLLKINGIIITETTNFICSKLSEPQKEKLSSCLDDLDSNFDEIEETNVQPALQVPQIQAVPAPQPEPVQVPPPPSVPKKFTVLYHLDSSRELEYNNNDHSYVYNCCLENVSEIEFMSIVFDNSDYIVTEYRNSFKINDVIITVPSGDYSAESLRDQIQNQINSSKCNVKLSLSKSNHTFSFSTDSVSIAIDFTVRNSINKVLGFERHVLSLSSKEPLFAKTKHRVVRSTFINALLFFKSESETENETFINIPLDVPVNETKFYYPSTPMKTVITKSIDKILLKLTDNWGDTYNPRGRDISLVLRVSFIR